MIDLLIIIVLSFIMVPLVLLTSGALKIVLGVAFIIFFPGYTLTAVAFPGKRAVNGVGRLALSFGLSIAVVPLIGFALNYSPWGIRPNSIVISLLVFILITSAVAWLRRRRLPPEERFEIGHRLSLTALSGFWASRSRLNKVLSIFLVVAVAGAIGTLAHTVVAPQAEERFTEFYILGPEGKAENYPHELKAGEEGRVILWIVNHEHETVEYRVEIAIEGQTVREIGSIAINHEQEWKQEVSFAVTEAGLSQKVEFLLYKGESGAPYQQLHLWIDVTDSSSLD